MTCFHTWCGFDGRYCDECSISRQKAERAQMLALTVERGVVDRTLHVLGAVADFARAEASGDDAHSGKYRLDLTSMNGDVIAEDRQAIAAALARPRAAVGERYTGQGFLTPASGLDEDGMCNEHGRQGCRACVDDLLAPLADQAAAMPYRDGVIRIIAEAGKLNEGGHADWTVHAEVFADMILALQSPPAKVERQSEKDSYDG